MRKDEMSKMEIARYDTGTVCMKTLDLGLGDLFIAAMGHTTSQPGKHNATEAEDEACLAPASETTSSSSARTPTCANDDCW